MRDEIHGEIVVDNRKLKEEEINERERNERGGSIRVEQPKTNANQ